MVKKWSEVECCCVSLDNISIVCLTLFRLLPVTWVCLSRCESQGEVNKLWLILEFICIFSSFFFEWWWIIINAFFFLQFLYCFVVLSQSDRFQMYKDFFLFFLFHSSVIFTCTEIEQRSVVCPFVSKVYLVVNMN